MERGKRMEYVNSTAGAVPIKNKKGEVSMKKVKVNRYISGMKPDFADEDNTSGSEVEEEKLTKSTFISFFGGEQSDLKAANTDFIKLKVEPKTEHAEEEEDDEAIYERRMLLKRKILERESEREQEDETKFKEEVEESEYESEEDEEVFVAPPLPKAVFIPRKDRKSLQELEKKKELERRLEIQREEVAKDQRESTLRMIEEANRGDRSTESAIYGLMEVCSEDEDDEVAYECWKIRELRRLKEEKEEKDRYYKEKAEIERIHGLTDEQRVEEFKRRGGKIKTNQQIAGDMKYLQKYYHRGAFYLDKDDEVFKRDFNQPTLEDHFDKRVLPSVMQVKNFGMSGRTKYTHLVDQDTTVFVDSPWGDQAKGGVRRVGGIGGVKNTQLFNRPSAKKYKIN